MARLSKAAVFTRLAQLELSAPRHGFDPFGLSRDGVRLGCQILWPLYRYWFRVQSVGAENIPGRGPVILAANHSGTLPFDAMMLWFDLLVHSQRNDVPRVVIDHFVPTLPFINILFSRAGAIGGSRQNVRWLLEREGQILLFPEGVPGIAKPFSERYRLRPFREGHVELAIRHRAAIVPVAVVGAEEQMPQLTTVRMPSVISIPHIPVPATPLPLPTLYHVYYGKPLRVYSRLTVEDALDPDILAEKTRLVQNAVQKLLHRGLEERRGVFW